MPRSSRACWDQRRSLVKNPVLLLEGSRKSIVDADEVMVHPDGGKAILGEPMPSQNVDTIFEKTNRDGVVVTVKTFRTMKVFKRKNEPPGLHGSSASLKPSDPTHGAVALGRYGLLLDAFVAGSDHARRQFKSRRHVRIAYRNNPEDALPSDHQFVLSIQVPHELVMRTTERPIWYMPGQGKIAAGKTVRSKSFIRQTEGGWEIFDGKDWTLSTETEARDAVARGYVENSKTKQGRKSGWIEMSEEDMLPDISRTSRLDGRKYEWVVDPCGERSSAMKARHEIIRHARVLEDVPQTLLGVSLHRSQAWVSLIESGQLTVDDETFKQVLKAIRVLGALKRRSRRPAALGNLQLPSRVNVANRR